MSNILVCGAIRNVATTLLDDVLRISAAVTEHNVKWLLIESDSSDGTTDIATRIGSSKNFRIEFCGKLETTFPMRTQRLGCIIW